MGINTPLGALGAERKEPVIITMQQTSKRTTIRVPTMNYPLKTPLTILPASLLDDRSNRETGEVPLMFKDKLYLFNLVNSVYLSQLHIRRYLLG